MALQRMRKLLLLQLLVLNLYISHVTKGQSDEACISGFPSEAEILVEGRECNHQTDEDSSEDSSRPSNNCFKERTSNSNGGYATRVIPNLRVTCNGTLTGWRAAGEITNRDTSPLLQIWRKMEGQQGRYQREGDNIPLGSCDNELQEISINSGYYECTLETPVSVRTGDIVGLVLPRERDTSFKLYFTDDSITNYVYNFHPLTVFPDPSQRGSRRQRQDDGLPLITLITDQDEPTTARPTTVEPITGESTTVKPTTEESTTKELTTGEATNWETTAQPTSGTGKPTTLAPTIGEPTTGEATNWETTVAPSIGESTTMESNTGEQTTEPPTTLESTNWETTVEPTTKKTIIGEPTTGQPTIVELTTGEATTAESATAQSTIGEPTTTESTTGESATAQSTTGGPTTAESTTGKPTIVESTTGEPTTTESITGEPTTAESTTGEPTTAESTTEEPTTAETTTGEPTTAKFTTWEPITAESTTREPTIAESITGEPTAGETTSTNREPTISQPHITTVEAITMEPTTADQQPITGEPEPTTAIMSTVETTTEKQTTFTLEPTTAETITEETTIREQTTLEPSIGKTFTDEPIIVKPSISLLTTGESIALESTTSMPTTTKTTSKQTEVQPTTVKPNTWVPTIGESIVGALTSAQLTTGVVEQVTVETIPITRELSSSILNPLKVIHSQANSTHNTASESSRFVSESAQAQHVSSSPAVIALKITSSIKLTIAEPMTMIAASNYRTIRTLTTTMHSSSIKPKLVKPTTVEVQLTESNPTAKPTTITPQQTILTSFSVDHAASIPTTAISPTVTKLHWTTSTTVWLSVQDMSTITLTEEGTSATELHNTALVTVSPEGLPSSNETLDITYNTGVFFGEAGNTTAISVGGLVIIIIVIVLVIFFFMLKRYRKKRAYSVHHHPAYTNPVIESINVTVNLGAENSSAASQPEPTTPPISTNLYNDSSQPPCYEQKDRTYMHLYSEPSLPAEDTEYTTIINTSALEDSGYYEVPVNSNNSQINN